MLFLQNISTSSANSDLLLIIEAQTPRIQAGGCYVGRVDAKQRTKSQLATNLPLRHYHMRRTGSNSFHTQQGQNKSNEIYFAGGKIEEGK